MELWVYGLLVFVTFLVGFKSGQKFENEILSDIMADVLSKLDRETATKFNVAIKETIKDYRKVGK